MLLSIWKLANAFPMLTMAIGAFLGWLVYSTTVKVVYYNKGYNSALSKVQENNAKVQKEKLRSDTEQAGKDLNELDFYRKQMDDLRTALNEANNTCLSAETVSLLNSLD